MNNTPRWLLLLGCALLLLIPIVTFASDTAWSGATPHPRIDQMQVGALRATDDADNWWLGLTFGLLVIATLVGCLMLAANGTRNSSSLCKVTALGGLLFAGSFVAMMVSYRSFTNTPEQRLWGPFPAPTSWMVFGVWFTPLVFLAIYSIGYRKWFASEESDDAVREDC